MRTLLVGAVTIAVLGLLLRNARLGSSGENAVSSAPASHAVIGSWSSQHLLFTFSSDGTVIGTDSEGLTYQGAWQPVGVNTATYTLEALLPEGGGQGIMGPLMVSEDGSELITGGATLTRIIPPDADDYDFATPSTS
jgi:hypothetical protein